MSAKQEKKTATLDLSIRTLKPRKTESSEQEAARVVVVTAF